MKRTISAEVVRWMKLINQLDITGRYMLVAHMCTDANFLKIEDD